MSRSPLIGVLLALCIVAVPTAALADSSLGGEVDAVPDGDAVVVSAREAQVLEGDWQQSDPGPEQRLVEYRRAELCTVSGAAVQDGPCQVGAGRSEPPVCDVGDPLEPLWRRARSTPASPWGPWEFIADWSCPEPDGPAVTGEDFRRLPLVPSAVRVQPAHPRVLINKPTITMADPAPQTLTATVLGRAVEVRATPSSYTWDYGDGSDPLTTTSPGHPYPSHDVHHTYAAPGTYTITLTTTWTGQYRVAGVSTWTPITGTATTTTSPDPIEAVEVRTQLVAGR